MTQAESIVVEFTAAPEYVAVARRVAEVVGARAGLAENQLEELQIAVSEICNRLVTAAQGAGEARPAVCLRFWIEPDRVVALIEGTEECLRHAVESLLDEGFVWFLMRRLIDRVMRAEGTYGPALRLEKYLTLPALPQAERLPR